MFSKLNLGKTTLGLCEFPIAFMGVAQRTRGRPRESAQKITKGTLICETSVSRLY
jgi:hypothetical protein